MRKILFLIFVFMSNQIFATDLITNKSDGDIWYATDVNSILNHLDGTLFPISSSTRNKIDDTCDFGSGTYRWRNAYFSGLVGIGTGSPSTPLHVSGTSDPSGGVVRVHSTNSVTANAGGSIAFGGLYTGSTPTNWASIAGLKDNATDGEYGGYMSFYTRTHGGSFSEKLRILSGGNIGVCTIAPDKALEINSATGANLRLTYNDSNGSASNYADLSISSGGDLTISPSGGQVIAANFQTISGSDTTDLKQNSVDTDLINNSTGDINYQITGTNANHDFRTATRSIAKIGLGAHRSNANYGDEIKYHSPVYASVNDVAVYVTANSSVCINFEYFYQCVNGTTISGKSGKGTAVFNNSAGTVTANIVLHDEIDLGGIGTVTATCVDTTGPATAIRFALSSAPTGTKSFYFTGRALGDAKNHTNNLYKIIE